MEQSIQSQQFENILARIETRKELFYDAPGLKTRDFDHLIVPPVWVLGMDRVQFTGAALNQLLQIVGIPVKYFNKCPDHLKAANYSYFRRSNNRDYLVRFKRGDTPTVRAVLSAAYGIHDDHQVLPVAIQALDQHDCQTLFFGHDEHITRLEVRFNDLTVQHEGHTYHAGVAITNSETGHSAIWIEPIVIAPHYKIYNRRSLLAQGADIRSVHRGEFDPERVAQQISFARDVGQVGIVQVLEAQNEMMNKAKAIQFIKSCDTMPVRFADIMEEEWEHQILVSKAEAWTKILELAHQLPLFQRTQVEQDVGRWTGVFHNYQERIDAIMHELSEQEV